MNEYCQYKDTKINLQDLNFEYEMNKEGLFNCIVKLNGKVYNNNLACKSKKAAKNEIAEYVYNCLVGANRDNNFFSEDVIECLSANNISINDLEIETYDCDDNKFICVIFSPKFFYNESYLSLEPKTKEEINEDFLKFLKKVLNYTSKEVKKENISNSSEYTLKDYQKLYNIPIDYKIEKGKKHIKCICYALGIVIGEGKEKKLDDKKIKELAKKAKRKADEEGLKTIRKFIENKQPIFEPYSNQKKLILNINININSYPLEDSDTKYNGYIQNVTQNFISTSSKKEEKKYLSDINNLITDIMNKVKKDKRISGSYLIKKINNYEVWNLITYEIIVFIEFRIEYIDHCYATILKRIKEVYEEESMEILEIKDNKCIRIRLRSGCTFLIYIGTPIYEELLSKSVLPFKDCLDIERKYIQFVVLWSNLILYQDFTEDEPYDGYTYYLKEQERIFTVLGLYSWDYTSKMLQDNRKKRHIYILSFIVLLNMIINYKELNICWYEKKTKPPTLMDPISNKNLITSTNNFMWKAFKDYCNKFYKIKEKINLFPDEDEIAKKNIKILFKPYPLKQESFKCIKDVKFKITDDDRIKIKSSLIQISEESKQKVKLNVILNSLQSYLLLNIYDSETSIEIQNLNNEKNNEKFNELNKKLKRKLKYSIKEFFKTLNKDTHVGYVKDENFTKRVDINTLYFFLGNNINVSIDMIINIE